MMKRIVILVGIVILILSVAALINQFITLESRTENMIYVGGTGKGNFSSIQDAINSSKTGNTIFIYSGIYYEKNLEIEKNNIKIVGENKETTIIDGTTFEKNNCTAAINIFSNNVILQGFTIKNIHFGIIVHGYNNKIDNVIISDTGENITNCSMKSYALFLSSSHNNTITNIEFYNNSNSIMLFDNCNNNKIYQNNITNNHNNGLTIFNSSENNIIYQNNFIINTQNAYDESSNIWFYESQGNFWDDYNGTDENNDSIGDTPYFISGGISQDDFPLIKPFILEEKIDEFIVDEFSLYTMLIIGMIVAIIFVLPIAIYWRKKYFT
jgi:hypothetical protein